MNNLLLYLSLFIIFSSNNTQAQTLYFEPLQAEPFQDDMITDLILSSDSSIVFSTIRFGNLFEQYNKNFADIYANDTIMMDLTQYNLYNKTKKRLNFKKPSSDSIIITNAFNLYIDKKKNNIIFSYYQMPDSLFVAPISPIEYFKTKHIFLFDKNLTEQSHRYIPFDEMNIHQNCRPILRDDTLLTEVIVKIDNYRNQLLTTNIITNIPIDSMTRADSTEFFDNIHLLNDSTIIVLENSSVEYYTTQLDSIKRIMVFNPLNVAPGPFKEPFFNIPDTTYYYHTKQVVPSATPEVSQIDAVQGSDAKRFIKRKVYHDSVYNATNSLKFLFTNDNNYNLYYQNCRYATTVIDDSGDSTENLVIIMKFDQSNILLWKKYIGYDAKYFRPKILATPDSGCIVLCDRIDFNYPTKQIDLYYIKLDKDGNQEYNYLATNTTEFQEKMNLKPLLVPNPASNEIIFTFATSENIHIELYTYDGKLINKINTHFNSPINIAELKTGLYIWKINDHKNVYKGILEKQ